MFRADEWQRLRSFHVHERKTAHAPRLAFPPGEVKLILRATKYEGTCPTKASTTSSPCLLAESCQSLENPFSQRERQ
eukprot:m.266357 g.266357  ORF g.266357 m.266357 type:complete len:77 (+) comp15630_c0_seq7:2131-2361(+)